MATTPYRRTTLLVSRAVKRPHRILADDSYWNVPFLRRFLNRIDDEAVHQPIPALAMAKPTITLADQRISVRERGGSFSSELERGSFQVRARFVTASVARRVGKIREAKKLYAEAHSIAEAGVDPLTLAELLYRHGWLFFVHNDPRAGEKAQQALELCSESSAAHELIRAEALILRGATEHVVLKGSGGADDFAEAIRLASDKRKSRRGRRILLAANQGLGKVLSEASTSMVVQERAYKQLERAKSLMGRQPKSVAKMQINWHMGKIAFNLGLTKQGERLISKARQGLWELGEIREFTLASLDLAAMFLLYDQADRYQMIYFDCADRLRRLALDPEEAAPLRCLFSRLPETPEEIQQIFDDVRNTGFKATRESCLAASADASPSER